jgi:hypothetical protein
MRNILGIITIEYEKAMRGKVADTKPIERNRLV